MSSSELKQLERKRAEVNQQIWAIEHAKDEARSSAVVGRCFKYLNSYGSGDKWWLYFKAERFDGGQVIGPKFEHRTGGYGGELIVEPLSHVFSHMQGYVEIDADEYEAALTDFVGAVTKAVGR